METEILRPAGTYRFASDSLMFDLGRTLVEEGRLTRQQLDELEARRTLTGESLVKLILKESLVTESVVLTTLSKLTGIPFRPIAHLNVQQEAVQKVSSRIALRYNIMPIEIRGGVILLATSEVPTSTTHDSLRMLLDMAIDWVLCTETEISKSIKHFYGLGAEAVDELVASAEDIEIQGQDVSENAADAGIIKFVNQVIAEAIRMNSTDIHIEPFENTLRLRYRIDGILQEIPVPKGIVKLRKSIASCVKIMAEMNIAERRKPHDGRIKVRSDGEEFDLRVSVLPTPFGETVCMRILNRRSTFIDLEHLGLTENQLPTLEYLSSLPHGVILLTGPTGSGKTTTLYAVLPRINTTEVKIITVEDPIEYQIPGITQIQVHAQIGLTFANILRSILRHDPDIILVGEIRDSETADIAVRASLTGHLVFSTLHTNDAPSAVTRLADMGVEPYLISSCLEGVIAQRLVRRVCQSCREEIQPEDEILEEIREFYPTGVAGARFYKGKGCPDCNFTGYRGRIGLFEIMVLNDILRGMIVRRRPSNEIKRTAIEHGLVTLRRDGWNKVLMGITTIEEVLRVAHRSDVEAMRPGA
ncbi:MAG: GspE/PulE family protein [Kiritimatiellae bacterium]|nr:GspE/PulE family protein [Kiritimatiellia bacterium]